MNKLHPLGAALLGTCLLQGCTTAPPGPGPQDAGGAQASAVAAQTASAYYRMGKYHQDLGDTALALAAYNYAIARDPRQLDARNAAAAIHAQQGRLAQAREMLEAVTHDYPALALAYNNLGYVAYLQGDYADARAQFDKALALDGDNARARNNRALVLAGIAARARDGATSDASARMPDGAAAAGGAPARAGAAPALPGGAAVDAAPARLELVQLKPNVYALQVAAPTEPDAPAAVAVAPAAAQAPAAAASKASRVEIANGNGIDGMARRIGKLLSARGILVARLSNERPYRQRATTIEFRPGYAAQAEALKLALRGNVALVEANIASPRADLRLVLGKDANARLAALAPAPDAVVAMK